MTLPRAFSLVAVFLLAGQTCLAQTDQSSDAAARKQYHVEVIVFQYQGPDSSAGEQFDRLAVEDYLPAAAFDMEEYNRLQETVSYSRVERLSDALQRLRSSPQYSLLATAAWVQPLLAQDEAIDVPLELDARRSTGASGGSYQRPDAARLNGSVRIYGSHLLFAEMDVRVGLPSRTGASSGSGQSLSASEPRRRESGRTRLDSGFDTFRISQTRRIKLDQIHYFDHPYFGAVLSVTRYEGPAAQ